MRRSIKWFGDMAVDKTGVIFYRRVRAKGPILCLAGIVLRGQAS